MNGKLARRGQKNNRTFSYLRMSGVTASFMCNNFQSFNKVVGGKRGTGWGVGDVWRRTNGGEEEI